MDFGAEMGQTLVTTKEAPGFILNYFIVAFNDTCFRRACENNLDL